MYLGRDITPPYILLTHVGYLHGVKPFSSDRDNRKPGAILMKCKKIKVAHLQVISPERSP